MSEYTVSTSNMSGRPLHELGDENVTPEISLQCFTKRVSFWKTNNKNFTVQKCEIIT